MFSVKNLFLGLIWLMGHHFAKFGLKNLKFVFTKVSNYVGRLKVQRKDWSPGCLPVNPDPDLVLSYLFLQPVS